MSLEAVSLLHCSGNDAGALLALEDLYPDPSERTQAAALALHLGRPRLAAAWAEQTDSLMHAAALLRLGERRAVLETLKDQPETARVAVLRARALGTRGAAEWARTLARQEGDSPALIAAATLMGELLLPTDPRAALRALAEGLKVSELLREGTDAHLLAVLSFVQARIGGAAKAEKTARKALDRSVPRSPARVLALLALGRTEEAESERKAGELVLELQPFLNLATE
ncbi:hypothetical protein [Deinococcus altitudinis]|uniref:hypothetical protein n=1 Tax=Deinococcus altitudinis TaxID=468914 RepID=UPI0038918451